MPRRSFSYKWGAFGRTLNTQNLFRSNTFKCLILNDEIFISFGANQSTHTKKKGKGKRKKERKKEKKV